MVGLDDGADTAKLVFEFVDAFWGDSAIEGIDLFAQPDEDFVHTRALCCAHHFAFACGGVGGGACLIQVG